jgi:hypothetical protein
VIRESYEGEEVWVQKALLKSILQKYDRIQFCMPLMYLSAMLLASTADQVVSVCDVNDETRKLGYELTGNAALLENMSEKTVAGILEDDLRL